MHFILLNILTLRPEFQLILLEFFSLEWEFNSSAFIKDDFLNNLLHVKWNLKSEDISYTFLSLLKRISVGLTPDILLLLFDPDSPDFPIYSTALKFWKHPDPLNRTSCYTILLNIFKFADNELLEFLLDKKAATRHFIKGLTKKVKSISYSNLEDIDGILYFLKELLLLKKQVLSDSVRELLFNTIIDKIFVDGFKNNGEEEVAWSLIIIGKIFDILEDQVVTIGICNRLFGNYESSVVRDSKFNFSKKWIDFLKKSQGFNVLIPYSYVLHLVWLHGSILESVNLDSFREYLHIFIQRAFRDSYTPTIVLLVCFNMSIAIQDFTAVTVTRNL